MVKASTWKIFEKITYQGFFSTNGTRTDEGYKKNVKRRPKRFWKSIGVKQSQNKQKNHLIVTSCEDEAWGKEEDMREGKRADAHSGVSEAVGRGPRRTRRAAASSRPSSPPATAAPACWPPGPAAQRSPGSRSGSGSPGSAGWPSVLTRWNATQGGRNADPQNVTQKKNFKTRGKMQVAWNKPLGAPGVYTFCWTEKKSRPVEFFFHFTKICKLFTKKMQKKWQKNWQNFGVGRKSGPKWRIFQIQNIFQQKLKGRQRKHKKKAKTCLRVPHKNKDRDGIGFVGQKTGPPAQNPLHSKICLW